MHFDNGEQASRTTGPVGTLPPALPGRAIEASSACALPLLLGIGAVRDLLRGVHRHTAGSRLARSHCDEPSGDGTSGRLGTEAGGGDRGTLAKPASQLVIGAEQVQGV